MSAEVVARARGVSVAFAGRLVLDRVDLEVRRGELVALVGPNGAGKSTLVRALLGLRAPDAGTVDVLGVAPQRLRDRWRVGYVPQRALLSPQLPVTVGEVVATGRLARQRWWRRARGADRTAVDGAIRAAGLHELRERRVSDLSGGEQQRVLIARALASEPEFLALDEPVAGVDQASQRRFRDSLVQLTGRDAGVLLVSHELGAVAGDVDRVVVLKRRVRFAGPATELVTAGVHLGIHASDLPMWLEDLE